MDLWKNGHLIFNDSSRFMTIIRSQKHHPFRKHSRNIRYLCMFRYSYQCKYSIFGYSAYNKMSSQWYVKGLCHGHTRFRSILCFIDYIDYKKKILYKNKYFFIQYFCFLLFWILTDKSLQGQLYQNNEMRLSVYIYCEQRLE